MSTLKRSVIWMTALLFCVAEGARAQAFITDVMTVVSDSQLTVEDSGNIGTTKGGGIFNRSGGLVTPR